MPPIQDVRGITLGPGPSLFAFMNMKELYLTLAMRRLLIDVFTYSACAACTHTPSSSWLGVLAVAVLTTHGHYWPCPLSYQPSLTKSN